MSSAPVPLVRSDAYLLAALTESGGRKALLLRDLIGDYDWLVRTIPTFDEASFGLPRLAAAGYVHIRDTGDGPVTVRATARARALRASIRATTLGGVLSAAASAVGAPPCPEPELEDRRLGRLVGLDTGRWAAAVSAYRVAFDRDLGILALASAVAGSAVVLGGLVIGIRRRTPRF